MSASETPKARGARLQRECIEISALLLVVMRSLHDRDELLADEIMVLEIAEHRIGRMSAELDFASVSGGIAERKAAKEAA